MSPVISLAHLCSPTGHRILLPRLTTCGGGGTNTTAAVCRFSSPGDARITTGLCLRPIDLPEPIRRVRWLIEAELRQILVGQIVHPEITNVGVQVLLENVEAGLHLH